MKSNGISLEHASQGDGNWGVLHGEKPLKPPGGYPGIGYTRCETWF